jgi:uncharacterized Zn finger protein
MSCNFTEEEVLIFCTICGNELEITHAMVNNELLDIYVMECENCKKEKEGK